MFEVRAMGLVVAVLWFVLAQAHPTVAAERWVPLKSEIVRLDVSTLILKPEPGQGFSRSVQLAAKENPIQLKRVIIEYGNGQRDDLGDLRLENGERATIMERGPGDYLAILAIVLYLERPIAASTSLDIFGLQDPDWTTATGPGKNLTVEELYKMLQNKGPGYAEVSVHYATTRNRGPAIEKYGRRITTYGADHAPNLTVGRAIVTIPTSHSRGTIERPLIDWVIWNYNAEDPARHFTIAAVDEGRDLFLRGLRTQLSHSNTFRGQALLFIHGYNTSFEDAIFRAAQLGYDIGFDGPILVFSWAARSGIQNKVRYGADLEAAHAARPALSEFLNLLARETIIKSVHIVAHSMGNVPALEVLAEHGRRRQSNPSTRDLKVRQVIFAAPDVGEQLFSTYAKDLRTWTQSITLFVSSNDKAIVASRAYADQPRAGGARCVDQSTMASSDYFLIDVSQADTSFLGFNHSTFAERQHIITDIKLLLKTGKQPPHERLPVYQRRGTPSTPCWWYVKN